MNELLVVLTGVAWPAALTIAWLAGEAAHRWLGLTRVSSYGIAGFVMASSQGGFLNSQGGGSVALLADFAFALILFELGYRINLRWLRVNPWMGLASVTEALGTFVVVFGIAQAFGLAQLPSLLLASLTMSTSPAAVVRVVNEMRCSGQVTERLLHLTALNCVLTLLFFKVILAYWVMSSNGSVFVALWSTIVVLLVSTALGTMFGVAVPSLLRRIAPVNHSTTIAFALSILLLTALTHFLKFSPLLAALAFGLVSRHRRVSLTQTQRNFGSLGDILTVLLFAFTTSLLDWRQMTAGIGLALAVVVARTLVKTGAATLLARASGTTWRKGALTGLAMTPLSVFALALLEETRYLNLNFLGTVSGMAAVILLLEIVGPIVTQRALIWAGETPLRENH